MLHRHTRLVLLVTLLVASACYSRGREGPARQRHLITQEEIASVNVASAYDVVRQLRPEFLRSRGQQSLRDPEPEYAVVYMNGLRMGGLEQLHGIRAGDVEEIRFISASDATTRWGTGHAGGVIEVVVKT